MTLLKEAFVSADEHPFADAVDHIWGVNVVISKQDFADAPEAVTVGFEMTKQMPAFRCGCCGKETRKPGGMIVLRVKPPASHPTVGMIPLAICKRCAREPDHTKITMRAFKTLTGVDRPSKNWKDMLQ